MPAKGPTGKADVLFSKLVRERADGRCWAASFRIPGRIDNQGCVPPAQCAHIIGRTYRAIRWSFDNAVCLCAAHHMWFTHHPLEWEDYVNERGVDYQGLKHRAQHDPPERPDDALARLKKVGHGG